MAINLNLAPMNFSSFANKIGLTGPDVLVLSSKGATVAFDQDEQEIRLQVPGFDVDGVVEVNIEVMKQLKFGKVTPTVAQFLRKEVQSLIDQLAGDTPDEAPDNSPAPDVSSEFAGSVLTLGIDIGKGDESVVNAPTGEPAPASYSKIKNMLKQGAKPPSPKHSPVEMFAQGQMKDAPTVPLMEATMMYQPVDGTSAGSRYFVVGLGDNLRAAARIKGSTLSVRFEGPAVQNDIPTKEALTIAGIELNGSYASIHVVIPDDNMGQKTLLSILGAPAYPFLTPIPLYGVLK